MHECNNHYGRFICKCGFDGTLTEAIEHCIKNQYTVKDDNRNPILEVSQNFNKHLGKLSPVRVRQSRY